MSRPSYNPACEACIHERICYIWGEHECQDAACYVNDCFEPKVEPEKEPSFFTKELLDKLDAISAMEPPETWIWPNPIPMSYEVVLIIKTACGMAASALRAKLNDAVLRTMIYHPRGGEIEMPDESAYNEEFKKRVEELLEKWTGEKTGGNT